MGRLEDVAKPGGGSLVLHATAKWFCMPQLEQVMQDI